MTEVRLKPFLQLIFAIKLAAQKQINQQTSKLN